MLLCFRFHFFNHGKQRGDRILRHPVPDIPVVEMVRHANNDGLAWYDEENNEDRWRETDMRTIQIQKNGLKQPNPVGSLRWRNSQRKRKSAFQDLRHMRFFKSAPVSWKALITKSRSLNVLVTDIGMKNFFKLIRFLSIPSVRLHENP